LSKFEAVILQELFRLTNESRAQAILSKPALTAAEYRIFIKNQI
jgi:hypothetical protein